MSMSTLRNRFSDGGQESSCICSASPKINGTKHPKLRFRLFGGLYQLET